MRDQDNSPQETRASARLPGLHIDVIHRQSPTGDAEQISINLQAVPSFDAFGRYLETANPFAFWAQAAQLSWLPWFDAARALMFPWGVTPALPPKADMRNKRVTGGDDVQS